MIALYVGRRGCGKTTTMIKDAYNYKLNGWKVITNMTSVNFVDDVMQGEELLTLLEGSERDIVVMIDEIQTLIDSRRSMRKRNVEFTYYIQQIRKRNVIMLATTQFSIRVDKAFREHVDIEAYPRFYPQYPVIVVNYYDKTMGEGGLVLADEALRQIVFDPTQVFPLFDTTETITPGVVSTNAIPRRTTKEAK